MFPRSPVPVLIFAVTTSSAPVFCQVHQDHLSYVGILGSAEREGFEDRLGLHTTSNDFPTLLDFSRGTMAIKALTYPARIYRKKTTQNPRVTWKLVAGRINPKSRELQAPHLYT